MTEQRGFAFSNATATTPAERVDRIFAEAVGSDLGAGETAL